MDSTYRRKYPAIELSRVPYISGFLFSIFLSNPFLIFFSVKKASTWCNED